MADPTPTRPLTIALLGWARLSLQAADGSGYNLNASELVASLAARGHRVFYLRSGIEHSFRPGIFIRHREDWRGVRCFNLYNSPNFAHAWFNFHNTAAELSSPPTARAIVDWLREIGAEVVHIHSLEGLSLDVPGAIRSAGIRVVITPHNHWYICPEVDLLHRDKQICHDYEGGRRCEDCVQSWPPAKWRLKQKLRQDTEAILGERGLRALWRVNHFRRTVRAAATGAALVAPDASLARIDPVGDEIPADTNQRFLANRDVHLRVVNDYGRRRIAGLDALRAADLVVPPSRWLTELFISLGVPAERCRQVRLGQPHFDMLRARAAASESFGKPPWTHASDRPLRLAFLGTTKHNKGLHVLAAAIAALPHETLARTEFIIHATGPTPPCRAFLESFPNVSWRGGYRTDELGRVFDTFDVGVHPHVGFDNSPFILLEYLNAGKFVIASRLGGPLEWIREGRNGLLFSPGAARGNELSQRIAALVDGSISIPPPAEVQAAVELQSHAGHVAEVEACYRMVVAEA